MDTININKTELLNRLEQLQKQQKGISAEIEDLSGMIQNLPDEPEKDYLSFEDGEKCWYVEMDGTISSVLYDGEIMTFENIRHRIFKTERMAKLFAEKTQFLADCIYWKELYDRDYVPDWGSIEVKYQVCYNHTENRFDVSNNTSFQNSGVYFSSFDIAYSCADWLNRKRDEK